MIAAFQKNAFQNNAFQVGANVGWMPEWRKRHDPADLERRIEEQRGNTFGRKWFDKFVEAEKSVRERLTEAETPEQRAALEAAVEQGEARASEAVDTGFFPPHELIIALNRAAHVSSAAKSSKYAELAASIAKRSLRPVPKKPEPVNEYLRVSGLTLDDLDKLERQALSAVNGIDVGRVEREIMAAIDRMRR